MKGELKGEGEGKEIFFPTPSPPTFPKPIWRRIPRWRRIYDCELQNACTAGYNNNKFIFSHFAHWQLNTFIRYNNEIEEHWLPRITEKLIMIGSQFIHMFTTSLGRYTR